MAKKKELSVNERIRLFNAKIDVMGDEGDEERSPRAIFRKRRDLVRVTDGLSGHPEGTILMIARSRHPDGDGEYLCLVINNAGAVDTTYIHYEYVESYTTEDQKRLANVLGPKRRKMNLVD